jgi:hypothetical protein
MNVSSPPAATAAQPRSEAISTQTLFIILIPLCACIFCCCCVVCFARFCACSRYFGCCPKFIRQFCIYEEDTEEPQANPAEDTDDHEADLSKLKGRGNWIVEVLLIRAQVDIIVIHTVHALSYYNIMRIVLILSISAQNLPRLDWPINDIAFIGRSDPFVRLTVRVQQSGETTTEGWQVQ